MALPNELVVKIALMAEPEVLVRMYTCATGLEELKDNVADLSSERRILVRSIMRMVHSSNLLHKRREIDTYVKLVNMLGMSMDTDDKNKLHAIDDLRWLLNRLPMQQLRLVYEEL